MGTVNMKKIQIKHNKAAAQNGKGFYIALAVCLVAIGLSAWFGITAAMQKLKTETPDISAPNLPENDNGFELPADTPITLPAEEEEEEPRAITSW